MHTLGDWHFIKSSVIVITSVECEIRIISMEKFSGLPCNLPWHGRQHETNKEVQ